MVLVTLVALHLSPSLELLSVEKAFSAAIASAREVSVTGYMAQGLGCRGLGGASLPRSSGSADSDDWLALGENKSSQGDSWGREREREEARMLREKHRA